MKAWCGIEEKLRAKGIDPANLSDIEQIGNSKIDPTIYDPEQVMLGMKVEMEHNDLTQGDPIKIAEIVKAHLDEDAEYYTKLEKEGL